MAAVLHRYAQHPSPGEFLARQFCQERWLSGPLTRPENFELHTHKTFLLAEKLRVNSWLRSKTGMATTRQENHPAVVVEQDLNTLAEEAGKREFTREEIERFFSAVVPEFDKILQLYYPLGSQA
jgi:hypothetical protein